MAFNSKPIFGDGVGPTQEDFACRSELSKEFHDSKSTLWYLICDHMMAITDGHLLVCDSDFMTSVKLSGKILKLKKLHEKLEKKELIRIRILLTLGNALNGVTMFL